MPKSPDRKNPAPPQAKFQFPINQDNLSIVTDFVTHLSSRSFQGTRMIAEFPGHDPSVPPIRFNFLITPKGEITQLGSNEPVSIESVVRVATPNTENERVNFIVVGKPDIVSKFKTKFEDLSGNKLTTDIARQLTEPQIPVLPAPDFLKNPETEKPLKLNILKSSTDKMIISLGSTKEVSASSEKLLKLLANPGFKDTAIVVERPDLDGPVSFTINSQGKFILEGLPDDPFSVQDFLGTIKNARSLTFTGPGITEKITKAFNGKPQPQDGTPKPETEHTTQDSITKLPERDSTAFAVSKTTTGTIPVNWGLRADVEDRHLQAGAKPISFAELKKRIPQEHIPSIKPDAPSLQV